MTRSCLATLVIVFVCTGVNAQQSHRKALDEAVPDAQANDHVIYHPADDRVTNGVMQGYPPAEDKRITIDNYRSRYPGVGKVSVANTRWAHFHMREILPTQNISRGNGPVRFLPVRARDLSNMVVPYGCKRIAVSAWLKRFHNCGQFSPAIAEWVIPRRIPSGIT